MLHIHAELLSCLLSVIVCLLMFVVLLQTAFSERYGNMIHSTYGSILQSYIRTTVNGDKYDKLSVNLRNAGGADELEEGNV